MTIETLTVSQRFDPGFQIRVYLDPMGASWSLSDGSGRVLRRGEVSALDWRAPGVSSALFGNNEPLVKYIEKLAHARQRELGWRDPEPEG